MSQPAGVQIVRPVRDGLTWLSYSELSLWAWYLYAFGATVALLRDDQRTSLTAAGLHGSVMAVSGIISGLFASRLIEHLGRGPVLRLGTIGAIIGVSAYAWPGASYPVTLAGAFLSGLCGTLVIITLNAFLLHHQRAAGPASLTEANALAALAGLIGPLAVGLCATLVVGWRAGVLAVAVGLIIVEILRGRRTNDFGAPGASEHAAHRSAPLPRRVYWSLLLIVCFLGTEFSVVFWSADLLRERASFGPAAAAASLAAVTGAMAIGRYVGSRLAERYALDTILKWSVLIALFGFALAWVTPVGWVMLLGMFVIGLGISVHWPIGVSRAVHASGGMTDRASALSSVWGSVAIASAPLILGVASEAFGFHLAFLIVPVLLIGALAILFAKPDPTARP
mgnify:CR=1 FL=1